MNNPVELRKIRDFGEVINDTFVFIGQNWKSLLKVYAIFCGFFIIASMIASILNQIKMAGFINQGLNYRANASLPFSQSSPFRMFGIEYFLALAFILLSYISVSLTTMAYIALYREKGNQAPTIEEVWGYFKFYFIRVLFSSILLNLGLVIGFVLCLIPGFYLLPVFSLIIPIIVFENTTFGYAFSRSFQLIKDNYWSTLGVIVITFIIIYVAMMVFILPLSVFNTASILTSGHTFNSTYLILTTVISHVCHVFYMIPIIAMSLCYFSLTEQKDNTGLLDRISNLGNPDEGLDPLTTEEY